MRRLALAGSLLALGLASCGGDGASPDRVSVVATTPQVADIARNVAGRRASVVVLLPRGADPHDYEPRPSDLEALVDADLVVRSGGEVDEWLGELVESAGSKAPRLDLLDEVRRRGDDPHWWQDPTNVARAAPALAGALARLDPRNAAAYRLAARRYARELRRLDRDIARCLHKVPPRQRKLVTTHDALGYFAARYDVKLIGALIPSLSTQARPSARETQRLVDQIRRERVKAIFPESALNRRLEDAVAREAGVRVGETLWTDSLGASGSGGETLAGALFANASHMVEGMTGGPASCGGAAG